MKFMVPALSFAVLSLFAGPSIALSQDVAAEHQPRSSSSQTAQESELLVPARPDDLPDAPQAAPVNSGGQAFPPGRGPGMGPRPLLPQTFHDKFVAYAFVTVGPRALLVPAVPAAFRIANPPRNYPPEWRQGAQAFGRNYGDQLATVSAFETGRFAVGAAVHEDLRYHPSTSTNFFMRTGHALAFTFVDRSDDGHARLAIANFAGLAAGSYVGMSYLPAGFNDVTHADQRLAVRLGGLAGSNIGAEFAPDIFRFLTEHHLPHPRIPIPEWWTGR